MKTLCLLLISGLIYSAPLQASNQENLSFPIQNQSSVNSSIDPEIGHGDDHAKVGVCCSGTTQCAWPANFPNGSYCYCSYNGQISPGTVCGR